MAAADEQPQRGNAVHPLARQYWTPQSTGMDLQVPSLVACLVHTVAEGLADAFGCIAAAAGGGGSGSGSRGGVPGRCRLQPAGACCSQPVCKHRRLGLWQGRRVAGQRLAVAVGSGAGASARCCDDSRQLRLQLGIVRSLLGRLGKLHLPRRAAVTAAVRTSHRSGPLQT